MKRESQRFISPVWAQIIETETHGDSVLVTGLGHIAGPIAAAEIPPEVIPRLDIFKRLRHYALRQLSTKRGGDTGSVYQFADATDDERLLAFVSEFGPVWGKVVSSPDEDGISRTVAVRQSLKSLRREQEIFSAAVKLLQQLNRNAKADPKEIIFAMTRIVPPGMRPPDEFPRSVACPNFVTPLPPGPATMNYPVAVRFAALAIDLWCSDGVPADDKRPAVISLARQVLCDLLNQHGPVLVPVEGEVIEVPVMPNEGIREALYFQLRRDFLAHRQIGICLNCGSHFPVFRRGSKGCSKACSTALRNRKYWDTHKKSVNRNRRKQDKRRK
jgi:hypothetical protein